MLMTRRVFVPALLAAVIGLSGCLEYDECNGARSPDAPNASAYVLPNPRQAVVEGSNWQAAMAAEYVPPQDGLPHLVQLTDPTDDVRIRITSGAFADLEADTLPIGEHILATFSYRAGTQNVEGGHGHLRVTRADENSMAATFAVCVRSHSQYGAPPVSIPGPYRWLQGAFHVER